MRLFFKLGIVPKPNPVLELNASADDSPGRWFNGSLDIKTVAAIGGILMSLVAVRVDTTSKLAEGAVERRQLRADVDRLQKTVDGKVSRSDYDRTLLQLGTLQSGQTQIYQLLIQTNRTRLQ